MGGNQDDAVGSHLGQQFTQADTLFGVKTGSIYARYSSDNQREESIEGQLRECKEYAVRNEITIIGTYIDRAFSAKTDNRPQFQQMIHDSNARLFDTVLVWKLDRFSRNRYDSAYYRAEENPRLPTLRIQLRDVNKRIKNLISAIEEGIVSTTTRQRLDDLEQQRANLEASIRQEEMKHPKMDKEQIIRWMQRFKDLDLDDLRIQRQIIDCFVNTVYLFDDNLIVNFNFSQESRRVTLHEVQDVFKESAEAVVFLKDSV